MGSEKEMGKTLPVTNKNADPFPAFSGILHTIISLLDMAVHSYCWVHLAQIQNFSGQRLGQQESGTCDFRSGMSDLQCIFISEIITYEIWVFTAPETSGSDTGASLQLPPTIPSSNIACHWCIYSLGIFCLLNSRKDLNTIGLLSFVMMAKQDFFLTWTGRYLFINITFIPWKGISYCSWLSGLLFRGNPNKLPGFPLVSLSFQHRSGDWYFVKQKCLWKFHSSTTR